MVFPKIVLPLILLSIAVPMHTVFYSGERFVNCQGNVIDCFGDMHIPCDDPGVVRAQREDIVEYAHSCNACVIVEDMDARYQENPMIAEWQVGTGIETPLDNLSIACADERIDCFNVEFREKSAASFAGYPIAACDVIHSFTGSVDEICNYNDCSLLNAYYWRTVSAVLNDNQSLINQLQKIDCSLYDYCKGVCERRKQKINLFDAPLLDVKIVHRIYENRFNPRIFVCAGANHIERIRPILLKLGYKSKGFIKNEVLMNKRKHIKNSCALSINDYFNTFDQKTVWFNDQSFKVGKLL